MTHNNKSGKKETRLILWQKKAAWKMISLVHRRTNLKPISLMMDEKRRLSRIKLEF
jgi:hypothetical protein